MWGQPGKKLLFMGQEFGQGKEWNHDQSLDWHLTDHPLHAGVMQWVADLNHLLRSHPAMYELDHDPEGFQWIDFTDATNSVLSFARRDKRGRWIVFLFNFTPVVRHGYRVGVPASGWWRELLNSDAEAYGGSGVGNGGGVDTDGVPQHAQPDSVRLTLPPLATVVLGMDA